MTEINKKREKVLIIGANGFLGRYLIRRFQATHDVFGMDLDTDDFPFDVPFESLDITNESETLDKISRIKPDLTILTAAMTNVDACEDHPIQAYKVNALGPLYVARAVQAIKGRLIFLSTDFVFNGMRGDYVETDLPFPISIYGNTKLAGEYFVRSVGCPVLVCRTSVIYGWPDPGRRDNFFSWAYKALQAGKALTIIDSQITCPTLVNDLAEILFDLRIFSKSSVYHTTGAEAVSRYQFVHKIAENFHFDLDLVNKVDFFQQKASRPANSSLKINKLNSKLGKEILKVSQRLQTLQNMN